MSGIYQAGIKNRPERGYCTCKPGVQLPPLQKVTKPQVQRTICTCELSLDKILNYICICSAQSSHISGISTLRHHYSVSAKVPRHPKICIFVCQKCWYLGTFSEPQSYHELKHSSLCFYGGQVEDTALGDHLIEQVQYRAATPCFLCSTSWTDRWVIGKIGIQLSSQFQRDSLAKETWSI